MSKLLRKVTAISIAALSLTSPVAQAAPSQEVKIGFAGPLSGPSDRIGKDLENGANLAISDANRSHLKIAGRAVTFTLVSEDDQSDPRTAVTVAQRLVDAGVVGVVGHWNTGTSIPASRIYQTAGIPQIAPASTGHQYTLQGYATSFRAMGHDDIGGSYTGRYAVQTLKAKRIAVLDDRTAFGAGLADQFVKGVKAAGGTVLVREYVTDKTTDFNAVLTSLKGKKVDLVFFGGLDVQAAPIARTIHQLGFNARLLGAGGFVSQTFLKLAGKSGEGVTALEPGLPISSMPKGKAFDAAYKARYHAPIELHAPFAYDATRALIAAMQAANSTEPAKYLPALKKLNYPGVTGRIAFDAQGNLLNPAFTIFQVQKGAWVPVSTLGGSKAGK